MTIRHVEPGEPSLDLTRCALVMLLGFYVVLQLTHAWVVDDAYITLRTVHNFVNGYGLRWNPDERVQSYTHPLWMFLLSAVYFVTRESFYTTILVSFVVSLGAVFLVLRGPLMRHARYRGPLFMAVLLGSKAFLDYSSSGLENPLSHWFIAAFYSRFLTEEQPSETPAASRRRGLFYGGIAALAFTNRMDSILLFAPACCFVLVQERKFVLAFVRGSLVGAIPAVGWLLFSFFYYGTVVPNTAIAKLGGPRVTGSERLTAGIAYFADSLMLDPLTLLLCGVSVALAFISGRRRAAVAAGGILVYLLYVLTTGAIGTHMSGRFFSSTLFLAAVLLVSLADHAAMAYGATVLTASWMIASPASPLSVGFAQYGRPRLKRADGAIIDTRDYVLQEGAALLNVVAGKSMPQHDWYKAGKQFRKSPERVHLGGLVVSLAIGYSAFAAGPDKHFIDLLGLSDPLISRLPLANHAEFRPGHFFRKIPEGYVESIQNGTNQIADPDLRAYYDAIRSITRDPLFSADRLRTLLAFSAGGSDAQLDAYARRNDLRAP